MNGIMTLNQVPEGCDARVKMVRSAGAMKRRLMDLGLVAGTLVCCALKSPAGDPAAYLIRGAVIALRSEDASCIIVETV